MQESQIPIERYLAELAPHLDMSPEERAGALLEIRTHLEELAATHLADGADPISAQRMAIQEFGNVRRLGRRLSAGHLAPWNGGRWLQGIGAGALLSWSIWTVGTFPVMQYYYTTVAVMRDANTSMPIPVDPWHTFIQSTPFTGEAFYAYLTLGWYWVTPALLLYCVAPFLWGIRARQWWAPGLAYGLGTWLAIPWAILYWFFWNHGDWAFTAEAQIVTLALPLALLASWVGHYWRQLRETQRLVAASAA